MKTTKTLSKKTTISKAAISKAMLGVAAIGLVAAISFAAPTASLAKSAEASPAIAEAVAADSRSEKNRQRDQYRNPAETLAFFGVEGSDVIVEIWPGRGWYSEVLAPLSKAGGGTLYAASGWERGLRHIRTMQAEKPAVYGEVKLVEFPNAGENPKVPDGSADVVLTFRNVHNWRFRGADYTSKAFQQMFAMLKPGGVLGVVEHRLDESDDSAKEEESGYMKESSVIRFAEAAGFRLVARSEHNANPKDTKDHPRGVWNLPPVLRGGEENRAQYLAIGESDRMTLKFIKPAE